MGLNLKARTHQVRQSWVSWLSRHWLFRQHASSATVMVRPQTWASRFSRSAPQSFTGRASRGSRNTSPRTSRTSLESKYILEGERNSITSCIILRLLSNFMTRLGFEGSIGQVSTQVVVGTCCNPTAVGSSPGVKEWYFSRDQEHISIVDYFIQISWEVYIIMPLTIRGDENRTHASGTQCIQSRTFLA